MITNLIVTLVKQHRIVVLNSIDTGKAHNCKQHQFCKTLLIKLYPLCCVCRSHVWCAQIIAVILKCCFIYMHELYLLHYTTKIKDQKAYTIIRHMTVYTYTVWEHI